MRRDLHHRWLKLKRHLRSCSTSTRALRDAARALSRGSLCRLAAWLPPRARSLLHRPPYPRRERPRRALPRRAGL